MVIDTHVHTKPLSADSTLDPEAAIREAKEIGLDGICFTEHNRAWPREEIARLSEKWEFLVLSGVEVDTAEGHVLVFGLHRDFDRVVRAAKLRDMVEAVGGFMVAAHPFKGFRVFGFSELNLSPEQGSQRPIFRSVDALEGFSGKTIEKESLMAEEVARILDMKMTGGSDAHSVEGVGNSATFFERAIRDEAGLIEELRAGRFRAGHFRK